MIKKFNGVPLSILELALVNEGSDAAESFQNSIDLAQHAEEWGYNRFWLAEHHNMPGVASSATSLLIGLIAGKTKHLRVGSGGVMLPNHAPLVIAEQFGTLETLYPGRIDLGIGRAPGTDQATAYALRRTLHSSGEDFPENLAELRTYFSENKHAYVRAYPGTGLNIPVWLLGSSDYSARLAAQLGLPFSFASHFAPQLLIEALEIYHQNFRPSGQLDAPYAMVGINIVAADTDEEAAWHATSLQQKFLNLAQGITTKFPPPKNVEWSVREKSLLSRSLDPHATIIGSPETVRVNLQALLEKTRASEFIISSPIFDHQARLRSFEIVAELME